MIRLKNILLEDNGMKPLNKSAATQLPAIIDRKKSMAEFEKCVEAYGFKYDSTRFDKKYLRKEVTTWSREAKEGVRPEMAIAILNTTHEYVIGTKKWKIWDVWRYFSPYAKVEPDFSHRGTWKEGGCKELQSNINDLAKKVAPNIWPSLSNTSIKKKIS